LGLLLAGSYDFEFGMGYVRPALEIGVTSLLYGQEFLGKAAPAIAMDCVVITLSMVCVFAVRCITVTSG
jgi:hypothetical protein